MSHFIGPIFHALGIDEKTQLFWMLLIMIAAFVVYAIRLRRFGRVYPIIFVVMGFALFLFLFSESSGIRGCGLVVLIASIAAAFAWEALRRRRGRGIAE